MLARAVLMNYLWKNFLSRPALTVNYHVKIGGRNLARYIYSSLQQYVVPDDPEFLL
jgi:hypothetical protein